MSYTSFTILFTSSDTAYPINHQNFYIDESNQSLLTFDLGYHPDFTESITLKFWVTGLFEDELLPPTGDLNSDGEINVVDVVILVNSILGEG